MRSILAVLALVALSCDGTSPMAPSPTPTPLVVPTPGPVGVTVYAPPASTPAAPASAAPDPAGIRSLPESMSDLACHLTRVGRAPLNRGTLYEATWEFSGEVLTVRGAWTSPACYDAGYLYVGQMGGWAFDVPDFCGPLVAVKFWTVTGTPAYCAVRSKPLG